MEEPFLSAIITDEAEAAITHESFDGACRHSALLRSRSCSTIPANFCHLAAAFSESLGMHRRCTMPAPSPGSGGGHGSITTHRCRRGRSVRIGDGDCRGTDAAPGGRGHGSLPAL